MRWLTGLRNGLEEMKVEERIKRKIREWAEED